MINTTIAWRPALEMQNPINFARNRVAMGPQLFQLGGQAVIPNTRWELVEKYFGYHISLEPRNGKFMFRPFTAILRYTGWCRQIIQTRADVTIVKEQHLMKISLLSSSKY